MHGEMQINQYTNQGRQKGMQPAEGSARLLLDIFVHHFQRLAGEALKVKQLSGVWYAQQKSQQDLLQGIAYAKTQQWIDPLHEAFRLTKAGYFAASVKHHR